MYVKLLALAQQWDRATNSKALGAGGTLGICENAKMLKLEINQPLLFS